MTSVEVYSTHGAERDGASVSLFTFTDGGQ